MCTMPAKSPACVSQSRCPTVVIRVSPTVEVHRSLAKSAVETVDVAVEVTVVVAVVDSVVLALENSHPLMLPRTACARTALSR